MFSDAMKKKMNSLLYGTTPDERIVAVQQLNDSTMRVYFRTTIPSIS